MPKLLIVEDHPMTAMITEEIFAPMIEPHEVCFVENMAQLLKTETAEIDIVLSDLQIPDSSPEQVLDWVSLNLSHARRFFFTSIQDEQIVEKIKLSGAVYLSKSTRFKDIVNELQLCLKKNMIRTNANEVRGVYQSLIQAPGSAKPLTIKQAKVMEHLSNGSSVKQIAKELKVSPDTVKAHLHDAFLRLDASNGKEAVSRFLESRRMAERLYGKEVVQQSMCDIQ
jgi:DNA-binding NarL/FixJ family response regulator